MLFLRRVGHKKTSPLAISPQLFHYKLKTLLFNKSFPDFFSSPYLPPRLNSKHHPPQPSDCLPAWRRKSIQLVVIKVTITNNNANLYHKSIQIHDHYTRFSNHYIQKPLRTNKD